MSRRELILEILEPELKILHLALELLVLLILERNQLDELFDFGEFVL